MQVASEIRKGNVKEPKKVKLEHFKMPFVSRALKRTKSSLSTAVERSKAIWLAFIKQSKKDSTRVQKE